MPVRLALLIALTSSALAVLPMLGSRLARLLANYARPHGARRPRAGAGRARSAWASAALSANLGVSRAPPPPTPKRFSRSPVVRPRVSRAGPSRVMLREASIRSLLHKTAEVIAMVALGLGLGVATAILARLFGS
jgi:hypothetical protein